MKFSRSPAPRALALAGVLAASLAAPARLAALPLNHKIFDGCPLCSGGGPLGPDGLPLTAIEGDPALPAEKIDGLDTLGRLPAARSAARAPSTPTPPPIIRLAGPPLAALDGPLETVSGYAKIAFSQLAGFTFAAPAQPLPAGTAPPDVLAQVPAAIKRLDGKKVVLTGFMLPTKMANGFATEFFFLSSSQLCCYGIAPSVNEWMLVKMKKAGLPAVQDVPVSLAGRLRVRAQWSDGFLSSIYELEGDGLLKTKS